jgi:hypothetical protein
MALVRPIKPCPFDGGKAELKYEPFGSFDTIAIIGCTKCYVELKRATDEKVIEAWNRRTEDAQINTD